MRSTIVGVALAALFLAALFALPKFFPREDMVTTPAQIAGAIEPGFVGARQLGPWILVCKVAVKKTAPLPFSFGGAKNTPAVGTASQLGRCRTFVAFRPKKFPKRIVALITFRLLGPNQRLAMIVHMPPLAKTGDLVSLIWGKKALNLPVSVCEKGFCVATGALAAPQEAVILAQPGGQLILPPNPAGKRLALNVPFFGLRAAISAMRRAEAGS